LESLRLLFGLGPYDAVHSLKDVEEVHTYVLKGIMAAMDLVAPAKAINVRRGANLYLSHVTLPAAFLPCC
jgi:hypothetical protein